MKYYLISTSDEKTWKYDRPVLLLGEWCRPFYKQKSWSKLDSIVAPPYGIGPDEKIQDLDLSMKIFKKLQKDLGQSLNLYHGTSHSERYWNIVIGPWLHNYILVMINRYNTLASVLKNYHISGTMLIREGDYSLATYDFLSFIGALNEDMWNLCLNSYLIRMMKNDQMIIDDYNCLEKGFFSSKKPLFTSSHTTYKKKIIETIKKIMPKLSRNTDAFIVNSYLPMKEEVKLYLSLGQIPQFWRGPELAKVNIDVEKRKKFTIELGNYEKLEYCIRFLLKEMIPSCFLEGYQSLVRQSQLTPWPSRPKFIFTSNNFSFDEIFKVWAASHVEKGTPYYLGQHGSNYGTLYGSEIWPELTSGDRFYSWGWDQSYGQSKTIPAFNFKVANVKKENFNPKGGLLLIERGPGHRSGPQDRHHEHILYQQVIFRFFDSLSNDVQKSVRVRLHHGSVQLHASDEFLWKKHSPKTILEDPFIPIESLIARSRLIVHSYDSSGILETLALNIPTICFWINGLCHLSSSAKNDYKLLLDASILFDSPEEAAVHVANHWEDINDWWKGHDVQNARKAFCNRYSRTVKRPIKRLKELLVSPSL